jgi:ketosteroid isomerase-like protein
MSDEVAIQQTINRYSEGCSRADWPQVMATFLPDGLWEVPSQGARFEGHAAVQAAMAAFTAQTEYWVQINAPAVISVTGDKATARSVIRECGRMIGQDHLLEALGFYHDDLVRTADGWKFARRTFHAAAMHSLALVQTRPPSLDKDAA